jgi:acyl-CoA synthetase (AMP-forming)/AMP-acid ligase II/thioesterase domain-containing protein
LDRARDFVPVLWASILGGFIPCPVPTVDAAQQASQRKNLDAVLGNPLFVSSQPQPGDRHVSIEELDDGPSVTAFHTPGKREVALLVLTSGSTGIAKAVMLTHANLLASMNAKIEVHALTKLDVSLNWVSFDHVAALLEGHMLPMYVGATQIHVQPRAVLGHPLRFLELISEHGVTMTFTPNFMLGQINKALAQAPSGSKLQLSKLRQIICGGEAIVSATARTFLESLAPRGLAGDVLWPAFGMTETCAGSVYSREFPGFDGDQPFAALGWPVRGLSLRIVDEHDRELPEGATGELQVRGPMVFGGYYENATATANAFTPDGWFKTGDRGSLMRGRLNLAGRSKDSIIVNGVNYFSHDIESLLERVDGVAGSFTAAFPTRSPGSDTEGLVIVFASTFPADDTAALYRTVNAIRNTVLEHWGFRPALTLRLPAGEIPKTSLGKIQRAELRKRLEAGALAVYEREIADVSREQRGERSAPEGEIEGVIAEIFASIVSGSAGEIDANASFFELGGSSIEIMRLQRALEARFRGARLSLSAIMRGPTVRDLARRIGAPGSAAYNPLVPLQRTGTGAPLFCVHPGVGEVLVFVNLAKQFVADRPVYALRARGFAEAEAPFDTLDELVRCYVAAIRAVQPHGPYALLGYSFGGVVAFEIAKTLERTGEKVSFLGVINAPPHIRASRESIDFTYTASNLAFLLSLISLEQSFELTARLRSSNASKEQTVSELFQLAPRARLAELDLDLAAFARWADVAFSLVKLGRSYEPDGRVAKVRVFYANPPVRYRDLPKAAWLEEKLTAWNRFSREPARFIEVAGEHQTVLSKHVAEFQSVLCRELEAEGMGGQSR